MGKPGRLKATRVADLEEVTRSRHVITVTAGPRQDLVMLSLGAPPDYRMTAPSGASLVWMFLEILLLLPKLRESSRD